MTYQLVIKKIVLVVAQLLQVTNQRPEACPGPKHSRQLSF